MLLFRAERVSKGTRGQQIPKLEGMRVLEVPNASVRSELGEAEVQKYFSIKLFPNPILSDILACVTN